MYYLRTKPAANPIQFTVDKSILQNSEDCVVHRNVSSFNGSLSNGSSSNFSKVTGDEDIIAASRYDIMQKASKNLEEMLACSRKNGEDCLTCSS